MNGMIPGIVRKWQQARALQTARHGFLTRPGKAHRVSAYAFAGSRLAERQRRLGAAMGRRPGDTV